MTTELIAKLEAGSGADQELEARILCAIAAPSGAYVEQSRFNGRWCIYHGEHNGRQTMWEDRKWGNQIRWNVTESLDAALSLVEKMLPGAFYHMAKGKLQATEPMFGAQILFGSEEILGEAEHNGSLPRALLIALLRSLETRKDGKP
jgi:hypothetical protein